VIATSHLADRDLVMSPLNQRLRVVDGRICYPDEARRKRIVIYGAGIGRQEAPLDDPSWTVWALNLVTPFDSQGRLRADVWFDLHQRKAQSADDMRWIRACPFPMYVPPDLAYAPKHAVRFPLEEIEAQMGEYWACTFAYQIALALYEGATDIGLYGVELAFGSDRERTVEWANTAYWVGRAEERGITIHLPRRSTLGRHPARYGFEYHEEIDAVKEYTAIMRRGHSLDEAFSEEPAVVAGTTHPYPLLVAEE
jgi:hypothetical protein